MNGAGDLIQFSTRNMVPSGSGEPTVEEVYASVTRMNIAAMGDAPLVVDMSLRLLPAISIAAISTSPYKMERTHSQALDGNDDFVLTIARNAGIAAQQPGRGAEFANGEAFLWLNEMRQAAVAPHAARFLNIAVPRALVAPAIADIDTAMKDRLPASMQLGLLASYAETLMADAYLTPDMAEMANSHMRDLIVAVLGARPGVLGEGEPGGVRAARLAAIKRDIQANLADPGLSLEMMAGRHGISPHYIRALFYIERTSFSDYVREQRLAAAFQRLSHPAAAHVSISRIAHSCGFGDLSWFNQAFKRRFGKTPSDVKYEAQRRSQ